MAAERINYYFAARTEICQKKKASTILGPSHYGSTWRPSCADSFLLGIKMD